VRSKAGEGTTAFERITDGSRTFSRGDMVRVNAKPLVVGRVLYFTVPQASGKLVGRTRLTLLQQERAGAGMPAAQDTVWSFWDIVSPSPSSNTIIICVQAVREEGAYPNGRLHLELLPAQLYGPACEKQYSLRRLEAVLSEEEAQEHLQKELQRVRGVLQG
jgi:hypothetical protein